MIVCHCKGVSDRGVKRAVREGAVCVNGVGRACGAGTGCGGCHGTIEEILRLECTTTTTTTTVEIVSLTEFVVA